MKISRYTLLFEAFVISWLRAASISVVSKQLRLSWTAIENIMERAVRRGLVPPGRNGFTWPGSKTFEPEDSGAKKGSKGQSCSIMAGCLFLMTHTDK